MILTCLLIFSTSCTLFVFNSCVLITPPWTWNRRICEGELRKREKEKARPGKSNRLAFGGIPCNSYYQRFSMEDFLVFASLETAAATRWGVLNTKPPTPRRTKKEKRKKNWKDRQNKRWINSKREVEMSLMRFSWAFRFSLTSPHNRLCLIVNNFPKRTKILQLIAGQSCLASVRKFLFNHKLRTDCMQRSQY